MLRSVACRPPPASAAATCRLLATKGRPGTRARPAQGQDGPAAWWQGVETPGEAPLPPRDAELGSAGPLGGGSGGSTCQLCHGRGGPHVKLVSLMAQVGSLEDPKDFQGLAHFCEHMARESRGLTCQLRCSWARRSIPKRTPSQISSSHAARIDTRYDEHHRWQQ